MVRLASHCKLAVLVLSLSLLTPWTAAALPLDRSAAEPGPGFVSRFFDWLTSAFGDIGCSMDPNGGCRNASPSQPSVSGDDLNIGCSMDPNGGCRNASPSQPSVSGDDLNIGCSMDPSGGACANRG